MNDISKHVEDFEKAMTTSGYTGVFTCNGAYPGKLKECLIAYLFTQLDKRRDVKPFSLLMQAQAKAKDKPGQLIDYQFDVRYERGNGFRVVRMLVTDRSTETEADIPELHIKGNIAIPDRLYINRLMPKELKVARAMKTETEEP
jgi:hypothetical protein